jgi:4-amino-4-deoxychorismate lyase
MPGKTLLNGNLIEPGLSADRAFQFGDGLFETLAVIDGVPCLWDLHYRRLRAGCKRLAIPVPDPEILYAEACGLAQGQSRAVVKIVVSAGYGGRGYARPQALAPNRWLQVNRWPDAMHYRDDSALHLQWCETRLGEQPLLAGIKHLNRLEQVLARRELRLPAVEGLMCDQRGNVTEGVMSNLFLENAGRFVTPAIVGCGVAGVVRRLFIGLAGRAGVEVEVTRVTREMVMQAERLYVTNSLLGVRPVASLGEQRYPHARLEGFLADLQAKCFSAGTAAA